jgi:hypothetical protein
VGFAAPQLVSDEHDVKHAAAGAHTFWLDA